MDTATRRVLDQDAARRLQRLEASGYIPSAQSLRVAAAACNGAAGVRRSIGAFLPDEGPDTVSSDASTLEIVAAQLAALAETLDGNR